MIDPPKAPLPPDRWVPVDSALVLIRDPRWTWARNAQCKYVTLRIDTRNGKCLIFDRDDHEITLRDLSRQLDTYIEPTIS